MSAQIWELLSCRARRVAERKQQTRHVVVVLRWRYGPAAEPVEDLGVRHFEQRLEPIELRAVEPAEMSLGKRTEDQIGLTGAAVPGAEQQAFAAALGRILHGYSVSRGHAKKPFTRARWLFRRERGERLDWQARYRDAGWQRQPQIDAPLHAS